MSRHKLIPALSIGFLTILASPAFADYGAIAYSRNTGRSGSSWQNLYSSTARDNALNYCRGYGSTSDCVVEVLVQNKCGALAKKRDNSQLVAAGLGKTRDEAGNNAIAACGSNCQLVTSICSNSPN